MISKNPRFRPKSVIIFRVPPLSIFYPRGPLKGTQLGTVHYAIYPIWGVAIEVMHAFTLDGQINYAKSCGSLYPLLHSSLIFLPLVTALKAALG